LQYLHQIGQLRILPALAGSVIVPPAVLLELDAGIAVGLDLPQPENLKWVKIQAPVSVAAVSLITDLGPGESQVLMLALEFIVQKTKIGKAMRATSEDYNTAALMGINVNFVISFTFALGSALAAAGGVLVGVLFNSVSFNMGLMAGLKAFAAAVLGGIGSIPGAMLGGLLLGLAEVFGVAVGYSSYRDAIAFAILVLVLLVRPTGLLGQKIQKKV
jgi:branched-chain amino acid transport system permease protein